MTYYKQLLNINSWIEFFSFAKSLKKQEKGYLLEILTKLILTTKPEYKTILKNVWILRDGIQTRIKEKLNLPSTDEGIDLVAETFNGEFWAIQCKFKGHNEAPTYKELSTFGNLANNYCKNFTLALLVHTGEKGVRKWKLLGGNYSEIGLEFWLRLKEEDWERIHKALKGQSVRPGPKTPRTHQEAAVRHAVQHFLKENSTRGRLIMPCGTGKSLTAFWIAYALKAKSIIVAVPSLALIKQSLEDWTREFLANLEHPLPEWMVICGDESVSNLDSDDFISESYALGIPTTTNVEEIRSFLLKDRAGKMVIFTTYQSSKRLVEAAKQINFTFELAILDEAHKTVGIKSKNFATLLLDENVSIVRRMFMTATERVVQGKNDDVVSMDDPTIYGDSFYRLSFKDAIQASPPIICDYKVLTISVTHDEIAQLIASNHLLTDQSENIEADEAQSVAAAIALRKATLKYGIRHTISFHRSIMAAENFSNLNIKLNEGNSDKVHLAACHISSKKTAGERAALLNDFANQTLALMTNARCLTEGVDVPAIDCVLFADPKQSAIDIVQAAGRALRPFTGKRYGYIMLPIIVPDDLSFNEFAQTTPFKEVARIISALSTQDEGIAEELRIRTIGRSNSSGKIVFDGTVPMGLQVDLADFADKVNTKIWERVAQINWMPFVEAQSFVKGLKLGSSKEWRTYCLSGNRPFNIPAKPDLIYKHNGWKGFGDWLGTGYIADYLKVYRSYNDAKTFVHKLNLKNEDEWRVFSKSAEKPKDIPATPSQTYKGKGWSNMGDWLGTGYVAPKNRRYRPFEKAREYVHFLSLKNVDQWRRYVNSGEKPNDIPSDPNRVYKKKGWISYGDWLGTAVIASRLLVYRPFNEGRTFAHSLNLKSQKEWRKYCNTGSKPDDIPSAPNNTYFNKGWTSWGDWLGTGIIAPNFIEYKTFDEARLYIHNLKLGSHSGWKDFCRSGRKPEDIPAAPDHQYKRQGWTSWGDWLGTGTVATRKTIYRSFFKARSFTHSLKLKNVKDWWAFCKSGNKPIDIPADPSRTYKENGWVSWFDWLGTTK
jgi:superfamily II DNA or RNA helicase